MAMTPLTNDNDDQQEGEDAPLPVLPPWRLPLAFLLFGLINNAIYVIVLSAAQDIVAREVPTGVVLFANIAPALVAKAAWPYLSTGKVQYARRTLSCTAMSSLGMLLVALRPSLFTRLIGIAVTSFSSGLGEMTFLQLSTCYGTQGGKAVGWFSSGTGAAGLVGALFWWCLRGLGVPLGLGLSSILPLGMSLAYFFVLPRPEAYGVAQAARYAPVPIEEEAEADLKAEQAPLSLADKLELAKPLVLPYMLPLFVVYMAEYTINQGVAPTLIYPLPDPGRDRFRAWLFRTYADYYVTYQLVYQLFVFFARSSIVVFGVPPLPRRLIPLPAIAQLGLLLFTTFESATSTLEHLLGSSAISYFVLLLIAFEGLFGGLAYVNVFHRLNRDGEHEVDGRKTEFRIASVGFADTSGIVVASLIGTWLEPALCSVQVDRGKTLCKDF